MKRFLFAAMVVLFSFSLTMASQVAVVDVEQQMPLRVDQRVITADGLSLNLTFEEPVWTNFPSDESDFQVAEIFSGGMLEEEGYPAVPTAGRLFRLPPRGGVHLEIVNAEYEVMSDVDYAMYIGGSTGDELGLVDNPVDAWYPEVLAEVGEPAIMRDFRVALLTTYPVQVNTARNEVRVYSNIEVQISFEGEDERNQLEHWPTRISEAYLNWYRQFLDWDESELDEFELYRGKIYVVMQNDNQLFSLMDPWFEWKRQKGWSFEILTDSGISWNMTSIRTELREWYEDAETPPDYIVIIGDATGSWLVPPGGTYGDHQYGCLLGTDNLIDVAVGRISLESTTDALTYVNKVLSYERNPNLDNTEWYTRGHVAAGSASSGTSTIYVGRYARNAALAIGYTQVDTAWYNDGGGNVNSRSITRINDGISFYNYRGYLGTGLNTSTITSLNNTGMLPAAVDITCGTGNWSNTLGINEAWQRAGTPTNPTGGIGGMGTATSGTHTRFNNSLAGGALQSLLVLRNPTLGDMIYGSKLNIWRCFYGYDTSNLNSFSDWMNLMGDPTVWLYTAVPEEFNVTAADTIELGDRSYEVTVLDSENDPVEGAWVTLYRWDDEHIQVIGVTDANGYVLLNPEFDLTGEVLLTVTAQNFAPEIMEIDIIAPNNRIGYSDIEFVDDGTAGTSGDGDGQPEAGETVGIVITAINTGVAAQSDVSVTATTTDTLITSVEGSIEYGALDASGESEGEGLILVEIQPATQNDWIFHLALTFEGSAGTWEDDLPVTVGAPQYAFVDIDYTGTLDPGETLDATVEVRNIGQDNSSNGTATLESLDPFLIIEEGEAAIDGMNVNQNEETGSFVISAHESTFNGHRSRARLIITTDDGRIDTTYFSLVIGTLHSYDPVGPDGYGYYAFDDTDIEYELVPEYEWYEIAAAVNRLNINDSGDDTDHAQVVNLPFPVQYYGQVFNHATVTGNGFISMGQQSDMRNQRNYAIPTPLGPNYMIAPFWDERRVPSSGGVYMYHDEEEGALIFQWDAVTDYNGSYPCTFELVIFDQLNGHQTFSGDNEILFQFQDVTPSSGDYADVPYFTTGIENGDQTDGIMASYWNSAQPGFAPVNDQRAILFSTNVALIVGSLRGNVVDEETELPMEGVVVMTDNGVFRDTTDTDGNFFFERIIVGDLNIVAQKYGFNTAIEHHVIITEDDTTTVNFSMTHPEFTIDPEEIITSVAQRDTNDVPITIFNSGNGPLTYSVEISITNDADDLDDLWDPVAEFDLDEAEPYHRGLTFDGDNFWICGSNGDDSNGPNYLYKYNRQGELTGTYEQPVEDPTAVGFYDLTYDGEFLYGVERGIMYQMEITETGVNSVGSFPVPMNQPKCMTYDPREELFWLGDTYSDIYAVTDDGTTVYRYDHDLTVRGIAWYAEDPNDYNLYIVSRVINEGNYDIYKMNPTTGRIQLVNQVEAAEDGSFPRGAVITNRFHPLVFGMASVFDGDDVDHIEIHEIGQNLDWMQVDPLEGEIGPGENAELTLTLLGLTMPIGTYNMWLHLEHNAVGDEFYLPVTFDVTENSQDEQISEALPLTWSLDSVYPNPFNPEATIRFTLPENAFVSARVFNVLGQQVAVLHDAPMQAGHQALRFNGANLSSGVYFLQFQAGPLNEVRKLVLMR